MDALTSWRDGPAKQDIVEFVERVCGDERSPGVPLEHRVAVFDNDGTLWCEKPMPSQFDLIVRRLVQMAEGEPALRDRQPWKAAHDRDVGWFPAVMTDHDASVDTNLPALLAGILAAHQGISVEEFEQRRTRSCALRSIRRSDVPTSTRHTPR